MPMLPLRKLLLVDAAGNRLMDCMSPLCRVVATAMMGS